jgi:bifunctional UDP-N-acetylglucosamine pyrophosphorylase/glucosamine-1-phosphate N-acetyltransferase
MDLSIVILAAGQGTRMVSSLPKVLHPLCGQPLINYSLRTAASLSERLPVIVVGHEAEEVRNVVGDKARFAMQEKQLGTGHALLAAESLLKEQRGMIMVIAADMPLLTLETLKTLAETQARNSGPLSMLTMHAEDARGFGRVIRGEDKKVFAIVEEAQATPEQLAVHELNVGAYCFDADWLWDGLKRIQLSSKGEYYLTDVVGIAISDGVGVQALQVSDADEAMGINTRVHLAEAEAILRSKINHAWMLAGVSMPDPLTTYIEPDVKIGKDTIIYPNTYLRKGAQVGEGCSIGPDTIIEGSIIGNHCTILSSVIDSGAILEDDVAMGPYCHLRSGAHLGRGVHLGNFGEVKNSHLAAGVKMGHFSYIGDATIGENVNIGAGTVTCNYDGERKNPTIIEDDVFIGSDTMLVAPVKIGKGAKTGAGAVVTHDVEPNTTVVGVPARRLRKTDQGD